MVLSGSRMQTILCILDLYKNVRLLHLPAHKVI
jgi:hypothetical protein